MRLRGLARLLAIAVIAALTLLAAVILAPSATAHAILTTSTPSDGQLVSRSAMPGSVELRFDEAVSIRTGSIQVLAADGHRVDLASVSHPGGDGRRASVPIRGGLADGSYLVLWHAVSADSHPVAGSFTFSIGHPGAVAAASAAGGSATVAAALAGLRLASYLGLFALIGGIVFILLCWPVGAADRRARRLLTGAWIAAVLATVVSLGVQAADDVGAGLGSVIDSGALSALLATQYGQAHLLRSTLLIGLAGAVVAGGRRPSRPPVSLTTPIILAMLAMLATVAADGHAGAGGLGTIAMAVDVLHLAAGAVWLGGLAMLAAAALPAARSSAIRPPVPATELVGASSTSWLAEPGGPRPALLDSAVRHPAPLPDAPDIERTVRRFSAVALTCVGIIVVSGLVQAWPQVGEFAALPTTNYGRLLMAKVLAFLLVIAAAFVSRSALHSRLAGSGPKLSALTRSVLVELCLAGVVLAVTSVLVGTTPARVAYRPTQATTVHAGRDTVQISTVPVGEHLVELHLYVFGADGLPVDVPRLTVIAEPPAESLGPVNVALASAGAGHFVASRLLLPQTGRWTLRLAVQESEFDEFPATATVTVR